MTKETVSIHMINVALVALAIVGGMYFALLVKILRTPPKDKPPKKRSNHVR